MALDSAYDALNYRVTLWNSNLYDTDAVIASFYSFYHKAGPLYESFADKIRVRVERIVHGLTPSSVPFASQGPVVVTEAILQEQILTSIYQPDSLFPELASILVAVENNNQTLAEFVDNFGVSYSCHCDDLPPWLRQTQADQAIKCSDGDPVLDTPAEYETYFEDLFKISPQSAPFLGWGMSPMRRMEDSTELAIYRPIFWQYFFPYNAHLHSI